jgi:hypothetical protein
LEQAIEAGWRKYTLARRDPVFAGVAGDSRFEELMQEVKAMVERSRRLAKEK